MLFHLEMMKFQAYIHGPNCKIVVQLTVPKLTSPCFLHLEGTRGVVNDLNIVFECKKIGIGS